MPYNMKAEKRHFGASGLFFWSNLYFACT